MFMSLIHVNKAIELEEIKIFLPNQKILFKILIKYHFIDFEKTSKNLTLNLAFKKTYPTLISIIS